MKPEEKARQDIDSLMSEAGWTLQNHEEINLGASLGVAVRDFPLGMDTADYLLFVDRKAVGVVEAKPAGHTLGGVDFQSEKYLHGLPEYVVPVQTPLPFAYESTGVETLFRDLRDPYARSRGVFAFHKPETLRDWGSQPSTLRARLQEMPPLDTEGLWACQVRALTNLGKSLAEGRPRALIQMATGSGKTYTAVTASYRLIKHARARRILFLVDRRNLGGQTFNEFQQFRTPDAGRKFTELYNVQHLASNTLDPVSKVCISTIQRIYSMLKGEELEPEEEEASGFERDLEDIPPKTVSYNPSIPIGLFDFIIVDECHRSIYNLWRQVLEYFDAFIIGLTATPAIQTFGFFNQNLVMEYGHERAVADGVNVGYDVFRIETKITESGSHVDAGYYVDKRDKLTREKRWEQLDEPLDYDPSQLDRDVVSEDQIRTVITTFRDNLQWIFPGRKHVPKTIVFAKDDSHAEDILHIIREEFGKGNEFCRKITYKTTGVDPKTLIKTFRNSYNPRIVVSVDMISTGTDIKPVECLLFMRDIKSRVYFEQMKGRGTRIISPTELEAVTPDARIKTHFVIVDAVGVCDSDKTDSRPLERKPHVSFDDLIEHVALGKRDNDSLTSLADRLARLDKRLEPEEKNEIREAAEGNDLKTLIHALLDAVDPDLQIEKAKELFDVEEPDDQQLTQAKNTLIAEACAPFDNPQLRNTIKIIKRRSEQIIDTVSKDKVLFFGFDDAGKQRAQGVVDTFKKFIRENKDELIALQILYNKPYGQRELTYRMIKELAEAIEKPPYGLSSEEIWQAYERLDKSKVRGAGPKRLLTDIISLLRFQLGQTEMLIPFSESVDERFDEWVEEQERTGREFTSEQMQWLRMMKEHIAASASIEPGDFDNVPFQQDGGRYKAYQLFGKDLDRLLDQLNAVLTR